MLSSIRRLQQQNVVNNVGHEEIDLNTWNKEQLVRKLQKTCLMIDEMYTAQKIEHSNGSFVGLNEEGKPAKTVSTFMIQSECSKYKEVVSLLSVSQLDTSRKNCLMIGEVYTAQEYSNGSFVGLNEKGKPAKNVSTTPVAFLKKRFSKVASQCDRKSKIITSGKL